MFKRTILVLLAILAGAAAAGAQEKPAMVVHPFTVAERVKFPYDMNQLQSQTIAELIKKYGGKMDIVSIATPSQTHPYALDGEVLEYHKGNTAERMLILGGSVAGRENAKIHFWLTDWEGKKIFETTEIIRQEFMNNVHEKNSGLLNHPFTGKIAERLDDAKLAANEVPAPAK